ncbi:hypothetical protein FY034_02995 [Trichlorobacter lovleyi]|uniref:CVNH domain-containing protein n=1 Tax=Trichlorobacter lovleyi TaxID=313985 RepID=UPI00223EF3DE|nr:CVNH domain-containing protein [Trichlorobacter lovleyi]QOX77949.1 hypothetical protein FY034_02995 [Trichlorobacter lovleyi]
MQSKLIAIVMLATTVASHLLVNQAVARDFSTTCTSYYLQGTVLKATCMTSQACSPLKDMHCYCNLKTAKCHIGKDVSFDLNNGISDNNGSLQFHGADFGASCNSLSLTETGKFFPSDNSYYPTDTCALKALCKGKYKSLPIYKPTVLDLNQGISNLEGSLVFDP